MSERKIDDALIETLRTADEATLRDLDMPWPETLKDLDRVVNALLERQHDYGTCVYAMSLASITAFHLVARHLGVTGFQASCADMDFLKRSRLIKRFRIQDLGNLLYPQYADKFNGWAALLEENKEWLAEEARKNLAENATAHPDVVAHWKYLIEAAKP
jgi:hypothetical protein